MNHCKIMIASALAVAAAPGEAAPVAATPPATGEVLILVPLQVTKVHDLEFGTILPSAVSGTVAINATTGARTFSGGVSGIGSDPGKRAYFGTAGSANQEVILTLNAPATLKSPLNHEITLLGLTLDGPAIRKIDPTTRSFFFGVGGAITIEANQPEGLYEATFEVTATYL